MRNDGPTRRRFRPAGGLFDDVRRVATTGSTNADLVALARAGVPEGVVVVADHQSSGRGRRDRSWDAPPGSALLASVLVRPDAPGDTLGLLPLAMGVAIVDVARDAGASDVALKWPNDVIAPTGKLAGILSELVEGAVVVGFGVNLTAVPPDVEGAVCLAELSGSGIDRDEVLVAVLGRFESLYRPFDPAGVVAAATERMATIGRDVAVEMAAETLTGRAVGLDDGGRLVVDVDGSDVVVAAGDVIHLRS